MKNAAIAVQVLPISEDDKEVVRIVDKAIEAIHKSGYSYVVGPFETTVEGDYEGLMELLKSLLPIAVEAGAKKVALYCRIFYSTDKMMTTDEKISKYK